MGYNTVAVLFNDFNFSKQADIGERIHQAMRGWTYRDRDRLATHFGAGQVISQAHADHTQIVAVWHNQGKPINDCNDLDYFALKQMADCLTRHGWVAKQPKRKPRV